MGRIKGKIKSVPGYGKAIYLLSPPGLSRMKSVILFTATCLPGRLAEKEQVSLNTFLWLTNSVM